MSDSRRPAARDQEPSPFSAIMEGFWRAHPTILCAAFVDSEGECVDYFSSLDPFEAKVAGAHLVACSAILRDNLARSGMPDPRLWIIEAEHRDLVMARASDDYAVVLVLSQHGLTARMLQAIDLLIEALGREAGFELDWGARVQVDVGSDIQGRSVPRAVWLNGENLPVLQILGSWSEPGALSDGSLACYRVALPGRDVTIVLDRSLNSWRLRPSTRDSKRPMLPTRAE